jgi:mono/diheme cytochrome c family protein
MKPLKTTVTSILTLTFAGAVAWTADVDVSKLPPAADQTGVTYANNVRPILEKVCFKCHGPEKQKGKLRLDSLAAALKGGEDGKVIQPGNSAKSVLVHNVARIGHEDNWMPPADKGNPLTKEQVGLIRAWVDQGAK